MGNKKIALKEIDVAEYLRISGLSQPAISYRMKRGLFLPGISSYAFSTARMKYLLQYDGLPSEEVKKYFRSK